MPTIVRQFRKWSNWVHKQLPHLIYFALATNYFNVFMSTTVLLGWKKLGASGFLGGASDFSNILAPWASGSRSLMLRAEFNYGRILKFEWEIATVARADARVTRCRMSNIATNKWLHALIGVILVIKLLIRWLPVKLSHFPFTHSLLIF